MSRPCDASDTQMMEGSGDVTEKTNVQKDKKGSLTISADIYGNVLKPRRAALLLTISEEQNTQKQNRLQPQRSPPAAKQTGRISSQKTSDSNILLLLSEGR